MAPHISETIAVLVMVAAVMLSAAPPLAAATTTKAAAATTTPPPAATRQHQRSAAAAAARSASCSRKPILAWGWRDQKRSQDPVAPRIKGAARNNALLGDDERRQTTFAGSQEQALDRSWTHAAFRAFHEMRAGSPPAASGGDGVQGESQDGNIGQGEGKGPLSGFSRLAFRKRQRETSSNGPAIAAKEEQEEEQEGEEHSSKPPPPPAACWHMKGRLTNTATGQTIALVEGVELARSLAFETAPSRKAAAAAADRRQKSLRSSKVAVGGKALVPAAAALAEGEGELEVDKALKPGLWTAFGVLACSKFFMYQDPATGEPMDHFRNTPVEKKQAVRTYERFSQVVSHLLQPNGRVLVVSEWGGRSVKAETANNNGVEEVEGGGGGGFFSGGGGSRLSNGKDGSSPPHAPRRVFNLHFFVEARTPKEERELKRWQERPGAKWIAFGTPPPRAHGCKEVYSYITGRGRGGEGKAGGGEAAGGGGGGGKLKLPWFSSRKNGMPGGGMAAGGEGGTVVSSASSTSSQGGGGGGRGGGRGGGLMSYTRYGECPTWYGTGRMCGLDVQAKQVDSFASLPAKLRKKVLEIDPEFEAGPPGTMKEVRRAAREKRLEREEKRRRKGRSLRGLFRS